MSRIPLENLSDRELLLLTAQFSNETRDELRRLNGTVRDNCGRIEVLERRKVDYSLCPHFASRRRIFAVGSVGVALISAIAVFVAKLFENLM